MLEIYGISKVALARFVIGSTAGEMVTLTGSFGSRTADVPPPNLNFSYGTYSRAFGVENNAS